MLKYAPGESYGREAVGPCAGACQSPRGGVARRVGRPRRCGGRYLSPCAAARARWASATAAARPQVARAGAYVRTCMHACMRVCVRVGAFVCERTVREGVRRVDGGRGMQLTTSYGFGQLQTLSDIMGALWLAVPKKRVSRARRDMRKSAPTPPALHCRASVPRFTTHARDLPRCRCACMARSDETHAACTARPSTCDGTTQSCNAPSAAHRAGRTLTATSSTVASPMPTLSQPQPQPPPLPTPSSPQNSLATACVGIWMPWKKPDASNAEHSSATLDLVAHKIRSNATPRDAVVA